MAKTMAILLLVALASMVNAGGDQGGKDVNYGQFQKNWPDIVALWKASVKPGTPLTPLNGECINQDGDAIDTICRSSCYDCVCGDSKFNDTCYYFCKNVIFSSQETCREAVTGRTANSDFSSCVASEWTTRSIEGTTDYTCAQACNCCNLYKDDSACFDNCQKSKGFYFMGEVCRDLKDGNVEKIFTKFFKNQQNNGNHYGQNKESAST